jgi:uncharacterized membrane protein
MPCDPAIFEEVPLFQLLDADERAVLSENVEFRKFNAKHRIYKAGENIGRAYIVLTGRVHVVITDEDKQEVVIDEPTHGDIFGLASMLDGTAHQTTAYAVEPTTAIELDRNDIAILLQKKPLAGLDMLTMAGRQFHTAQHLVQTRAARNANVEYEERATFGDKVADGVARFGGSWRFIGAFAAILLIWVVTNTLLLSRPFDPFPFILLNLFLSMLAAIQAPVIMMSQNRQDQKDRLRSELDYRVNLKAELEISTLIDKVDRLEDQLDQLSNDVNRNIAFTARH